MMRENKTVRIVQYVVLAGIALLFLLPLLWMLFSSIDTHAIQAIQLPKQPTLANFMAILTDSNIMRSFGIGLLVSGFQAIFVVLISVLAAYPLSRYPLPWKKPFLLSILFLTSLPMTAVIVPVYQMFLYLKFQNSLIATTVFMISTSLPYGIWMMKNFMDSVPHELEEAAWIDGSTVWEGVRKVVLPLMLPGIFTIGIFTFTGSWGNFFVPFILITSPEKLPASVTIFQFFGNNGLVNYGQLAAFSVLYTLPVVILYTFAQRYMSQGFSFGGAVK
ncbi:carbohydrate ABC transporter permease [Schleiferilactobacillus harbinensis]|jgi:multiple sugar transport system permease protein|uniref:carbohydrate ABC transporter permease n=1 Tax=Schleiferilactobacillus harbinensis TaxID=304207 RepID=UPI0024312AB3|nr:carbohydrate ABC transporter permease [Schleiferilactobacillus harbinensis]MCI1686548.1 carbohydrate ABC transporter permease [Schleiferilactobacillus harbinensis]MCI1850766.1 carbohydrate ABC transporter permease [Schleiferilactobacillus harbinensis]